jgi:hypothetical protein
MTDGWNGRQTQLIAGLASLAVILAAAPAAAQTASTVAVQAVTPTGDGRAKVAECSGVAIAPDLVLTAGHCLDAITQPSQVAVFAYDGAAPKPPFVAVAAFARRPGHVIGWRTQAGDPSTRRREIAADLALLRLARPLATGSAPLAETPKEPIAGVSFSGVGASAAGGRGGRMKRVTLSSIRLATGEGAQVAFASAAATVCGGDSGGPVSAGDGRVWGIVAAVLQPKGGCGARIVIAPVDPQSEEFRRMRAAVQAR